jgi:hypothetical protein
MQGTFFVSILAVLGWFQGRYLNQCLNLKIGMNTSIAAAL